MLLLLLVLCRIADPTESRAQPAVNRTAETEFAEAFKLYTDRLYEQALDAFADFRRVHPDHINAPEALYYEAESALILGREEHAIELFSSFERLFPTHPLAFEARVALGKYFYESQMYDQALETLEDVVEDNPPAELAGNAYYWMGESAMHLNRTEDALSYYRRAAEGYQTSTAAPLALYAIAYTYIRAERPDEAARYFEILAARYPNSPYAQSLGLALAEVYYELGDYERTISEVNRRQPDLTPEATDRATFLLAEAYNQLRQNEEAIVHYRRFTERNAQSPYYRRALYGLAWNYHFEQAYQWAADHFAQVHNGYEFTDPLAEKASYYEGVNLKLAQRPADAINRFRETVAQWPQGEMTDHALYELGITLYEMRMWQEANRAFSQLIADFPESDLYGDAYYRIGSTYIALGDFDAALESFDQAIAREAAPPRLKDEVVFQKAWLLYRNANYQAAAPAFMELYETSPSAETSGEALFWAAESFHQTGQLDRASSLFRRYLSEFPGGKNVDAAHYALGWTFFKQAEYEEAIGEFNRFLSTYREQNEYVPYRTDALLRLADSYYALKRYPEAIQAYTRIGEEGDDYALYQIGQAFSNSGDPFEAITTFRRLLSDFPESEWRQEAQYTLGYLYFLNQDYDQSIQEYQKIISDYPRDPLAAKAQYGIGDAQYNAGNLQAAIQAYSRVLNRYPNSPFAADAAAGIQIALIASGDEARASSIIDSFATGNPNSPIADQLRFRQAEVKYQTGRIDEAMSDFQRFIRTSSNVDLLPEAYFYLGTIFSQRGQNEEAENYLKQLVDRYPSSGRRPEASLVLGNMYLNQQRFQDALTTFRALESTGTLSNYEAAQARYGQGMALLNLGRAGEAEALLREAAEAAPDSPETGPALLGLARVYEQRTRYDEAAQLYRDVVERSQDETGAESLYRLGNLLVNRDQPREAINELSRLPILYAGYNDWVAQGMLVMARAHQLLGEVGEAIRIYDQIINDFAGTPYAETATREKASL